MRAIIRFPGRFFKGLFCDCPLTRVIPFDFTVRVGDSLTALGIQLFNALADGLALFFCRVHALDDVVVGHVGAAAAGLHGGEGGAGGLLLDHHARHCLPVGTLAVLLAGAFRTFIALRLGVVVGLEVVLEGGLHPFALQIQKHRYISNYKQGRQIFSLPYLFHSHPDQLITSLLWLLVDIIMSGEEYTRKIEECRRQQGALKKDILYRDEQVARNEPTFALDAEIRGQFVQVDEQLAVLRTILQNFESKAKDLNLMPRDIEKRKNAYQANADERDKLKRMYEESLARRVPNSVAAKAADNLDRFNAEYKQPMDKNQLLTLKEKQEKVQDDAIDDLIGTVKQMKVGQGEIRKELEVHDDLLNNLEAGMDENSQKMSKVRRNLGKLLQSSSYTCLVLVIILEIAGIVCNLILWKK